MIRHLDDREIAAAVAGLELAAESEQHLGSCLDCRRQVDAMVRLIDERRAEMAGGEPDWESAGVALSERLSGAERGGPPRQPLLRWWRPLAAAAATAAVAAAVVLLAPDDRPAPQAPTEMSVDEILAEVDAVLADDSIPGFEVIDPGLEVLESCGSNGVS